MRHDIISVSLAKTQLLDLVRKLGDEGRSYLLTRDGHPVGALVSLEVYEALLETSDVLSDAVTLASLEHSLEDEAKGRLFLRDKKGNFVPLKRRRPVKRKRAI